MDHNLHCNSLTGVADIETDLLAAPGPAQAAAQRSRHRGLLVLLKCFINFELQKKGSG